MPFTEGLCPRLQQALRDVAGQNAPALHRDRVGYLEALVSQINTQSVRRLAVPSDGKRKQIEVIYVPRGVEADVLEGKPTDYCGATDEPEPQSVLADVRYWRRRQLRFSEDELRKLCFEADDTFVANVVMGEMNAMLVTVNKHLIALQAANFGLFQDDSLAKGVTLLDAANQPQYYEESRMLEEYQLIGGRGTPILVGAGRLSHYQRMTNKGCCNTHGIDMSQAGDFAFFHDRFVNEVITPGEHYLMLAPGAVQFLTWNANQGNYAWKDGKDEASVIVDPFTGVAFDLDVVWDKCAKRYHVTLALNYDLFFVPADAFKPADELAGVNFTLHFTN